MKLFYFISIFFLGFTITSCETFNLESCNETNWKQAGFSDASKGYHPKKRELKECSSYINYDKATKDYSSGYADGLLKFCTKEFGLYWGREGHEYDSTCPKELENNFLVGYSKGKLDLEKTEMLNKKVESEIAINESVKKIINKNSCTFDSDCVKKRRCESTTVNSDHKCQGSSTSCVFDSDCEIKGTCNNNFCEWY